MTDIAEHPLAVIDPGPEPAAYRALWWPATVSFTHPERGRRTLHMAKVYATDTGIRVYAQGTDDMNRTVVQLAFSAGVNYGETPRPASDYASIRAGHVFDTTAGTLVVQPGGGCGSCGYRALNAHRPPWAATVVGWE